MKILGIQWGSQSTAAIVVDGAVVAAVSEERLSGVKSDESFPQRSIAACLRTAGVEAAELDAVAVSGLDFPAASILTRRNSSFSTQDRIHEQHAYWRPKLLEGKQPSFIDLFSDKLDADQFPGDWTPVLGRLREGQEDDPAFFQEFRRKAIATHLGVSPEIVRFVATDACQAHYGTFATSPREGDATVLTVDGYRSRDNATVWKAGKKLERLAASDRFLLGSLYRSMTLLLGFRPDQGDTKVMDLAPYAKDRFLQGALSVFRDTLHVDGLGFAFDREPSDLYFWFRDRLEGQRFDSIAGGVQGYLEELLADWARNAMDATGSNALKVSGPMTLNTKAMLHLASLDEVEHLNVAPAASDNSLPIGACYAVALQGGDSPRAIEHLFLGPEPAANGAKNAAALATKAGWAVEADPSPDSVAKLIEEGKIIGRCHGRSEFGPRALGHRSILAHPGRSEAVQEINDRLKGRDFWAPFSPSILKGKEKDYLRNPKSLDGAFMTHQFRSTAAAQKELRACAHPWNHDIRPQIVDSGHDPDFHAMISAFEGLTGTGGVLNTSFNVTGNPLVETPEAAFEMADRSDLDAVWLDGFLLKRPQPGSR